uniref:Uncharacterized protein n=1 Tax=Seriola dumerili TaxID=41447 RepID=A0A3B4V7K4_SERDU
QNIPIWSMTCLEPSFFRPATSCSLILMMRLAIPWTSSSTLFASSVSLHTTVKPPTRSPSHVFGKGLGQDDVVALFNEVAHSPGITVDVSTGKAL